MIAIGERIRERYRKERERKRLAEVIECGPIEVSIYIEQNPDSVLAEVSKSLHEDGMSMEAVLGEKDLEEFPEFQAPAWEGYIRTKREKNPMNRSR